MNRLIRRGMLPMQGGVLSHRLFASLPPLTPSPLPSRREAHLWYVVPDELKDASQLKKYMELLSSCERERVLSMNEERLQKDCRVNPQSIKFKTSKFGKPEIMWQHGDQCNRPSLQFNVSHSSSLIACGITVDVPIGIDVEEKQRKTMSSISSLARRYFSPSEVEYLGSFSNTDTQQKEFIKLWTLKEAYVKALGRGFSGAPFKDFTIRLEATKVMQLAAVPRVHIEADSDSEYLTDNWEFALFELSTSHYGAVCMERGISHSGSENEPLRLKVWKTIPFVEDEFVSGTDAVKYICGLS